MYANLPHTLQVNIYSRTMTIFQAQLVQLAEHLTICWRSWVRSLVWSKAFWWPIFCLMQCPLHHSSPLNWPCRGLQHGTGCPQRAYCDKPESKHSPNGPNQCQILESNQVQTNAKPFFIKTCKPMSNLVQTINKLGATARQALSHSEYRTLRQMEKQPNHG